MAFEKRFSSVYHRDFETGETEKSKKDLQNEIEAQEEFLRVWVSAFALALAIPGLLLILLSVLLGAAVFSPFGVERATVVLAVGLEWVRRFVKAMMRAYLGG